MIVYTWIVGKVEAPAKANIIDPKAKNKIKNWYT